VTSPPLALEDAQERLLALAPPLPVERIDVASALGRYLAAPLIARRTQPAADMSAMDGYAVRADDLAGPWHVIGESAAGHPFKGEIAPGQAVRIATGALMPADADAVILQGDVLRQRDCVRLTGDGPELPGTHVRRCGLDFCEGGPLLDTGSRIGPVQVALAIAAGHRHLLVRRRPRVAVLDTGDELCPEDERCGPHQIPASNGPMLAAMIAGIPSEVRRIGPVPDHLDSIAAALAQAEQADVIVTSGGASVGDHDLIKPAISAWGADIAFWRIAIKPGKPLLVAIRQREGRPQLILGLPGNPASTYVTAFLFLLPLLRGLLGGQSPLPRRIVSQLAAPLKAGGSRREFLRAHWDGSGIRSQPLQDSGVLGALAASNALVDRDARAPAAEAGDWVNAYLLENGGVA
jgi:molybdopterin molybdotransferase